MHEKAGFGHVTLFTGLALSVASAGANELVVVQFNSINDQDPRFAIEAKVERKLLAAEASSVVGVTKDGRLSFPEPNCPEAYYRVTPVSTLLVRSDVFAGFDWRPCDAAEPMIVVEHSTTRLQSANYDGFQSVGLSDTALALIKGDIPEGFQMPDAFAASYQVVMQGLVAGKPGAAAKTSDQLAAIYREAGLAKEAQAFSEIAVGIATVSAWNQLPRDAEYSNEVWTGRLVVPSEGGTSAGISSEALNKVKQFQVECGLNADGVVGWATYGCLAGGKGFTLPSEINNLKQASDVFKIEAEKKPFT